MLLTLCIVATLAPDVLPPGYRSAVHELVVVDSPHFAEHDFYAAPVLGFGGNTRVVPGEPFGFSSKYGTKIHALAKGARFPEDFRAGASVALAIGEIPVRSETSVPMTSPVERTTTTLRITSIAGGVIALEVVSEDEQWNPTVVAVVVGCLAVGAAGLFALVRRRRARAESAG